MGLVFENITLKNAGDVTNEQRGLMKKGEIRQVKVLALVDTGAQTIVINEEIRQDLGLSLREERVVRMANNTSQIGRFTEGVEIHWKNRYFTAPALVLDGATEVLLGAIPLEGLDVIVDPVTQQLIGGHGDNIVYRV